MKREAVTLALFVALPISLLAVAPAQAATKISSFGYVITAPGTYQVTQDLSGSGNAITVLASNVALHLSGHTLSGDGSGAGVDVEGPAGNSVTIDHGTVQGFHTGILLGSALNCKVSSVTASGSGADGITLVFAAANIVTDNTVSQNGGNGINVYGGSGNTLMRNTADRNSVNGISLAGGTYGNTALHNTATANGTGFVLLGGATQNTVQDNTCSGNFTGIALGVPGYGDASRNTIQSNTAGLNFLGIHVEFGSTGNTIQGNTATPNTNVDLEDDNPGCDSNIWSSNKFATDLVAGASDGGPGVGCIR